MIKKEIMHARTGGAAAVISKFKGERGEEKKKIFINPRFSLCSREGLTFVSDPAPCGANTRERHNGNSKHVAL